MTILLLCSSYSVSQHPFQLHIPEAEAIFQYHPFSVYVHVMYPLPTTAP